MRTKLIAIEEITRENFDDISILDLVSGTQYDSAMEFFEYDKNADDCFTMIANHDYRADEILRSPSEVQTEIRNRIMIDTLNKLIFDHFIICYDDFEVLD